MKGPIFKSKVLILILVFEKLPDQKKKSCPIFKKRPRSFKIDNLISKVSNYKSWLWSKSYTSIVKITTTKRPLNLHFIHPHHLLTYTHDQGFTFALILQKITQTPTLKKIPSWLVTTIKDFTFRLRWSDSTHPLKPPPNLPKLVNVVAYYSILPIFTLSLDSPKPPLFKKYRHNPARVYYFLPPIKKALHTHYHFYYLVYL